MQPNPIRLRDTSNHCRRNRSLSAVANPCVGLQTADNDRFLRQWFEVAQSRIGFGFENAALAARSQKKWFPYNKGGITRKWYGNRELLVNWENDGEEIKKFKAAVVRNPNFYFKKGITFPRIGTGIYNARYCEGGFVFDCNGPMCFGEDIYYHLAFLNSSIMTYLLQMLCPTMSFQIGDVFKVPIAYGKKDEVSEISKDNIAISKQDWDSHETSWDFKRNPLFEMFLTIIEDEMQNVLPRGISMNDVLQYAVPEAKHPLSTCMHNYKDTWETNFMRLHSNEEELNRQFIEIYGLQDELTPDVPLDEVTILQKGEISIEDNKIVWHEDVIIKQFISWLIGCFMGRYSVDKPGLIIASQGQKIEDLDLPAQTIEIDDDGIIPIIQEEDFFVDDMTQRIEAAVKTLFGEMNFYENMKYIKSRLGQNLRDYLYKNYYADHQQMYSVKGAKRPIYWLFSSQMGDRKKKGYFKALVYMHRMEADTLSKLHADYVHPYIQKIEQQLAEAEDNALRDDLTGKQKKNALDLAETLRDKVREVKAFETALVEMASARITIDLDDGVKANYPKFYPLVEPIKGLDKSNDD